MVPNMTNLSANEIAAKAATQPVPNPTHFYDQNFTAIIAGITLAITLLALIYKYAQQVGEMKGIKEVIDAKLESIDQKYNTTEKLQKIELDVQKKANRDSVEDILSEQALSIKKTEYDIINIKSILRRLEAIEDENRGSTNELILDYIKRNFPNPEGRKVSEVSEKEYDDFPGHA
jgi:hypothetical protein